MKRTFILLAAFVLFSYGCATSTIKEETVQKGTPAPKSSLSQQEQERRSVEIFRDLLDITSYAETRQEAVVQLEAKYLEIITKYPDAPLAQEGYYRLMSLLLKDYTPPAYDRAEAHYRDFVLRYPDSKFKFMVDLQFGRSYYRYQKWDRLLALTAPAYAAYLKKGSAGTPTLIYMYAESNNNLGNPAEAEAAYRAVIKLFPDFPEGRLAKPKLDKLTGEE